MADALLTALRDFWLALQALHPRLAIMGGIALSFWKTVRATRDVDVLLAADERDLETLLQQLAAAGFRPKHSSGPVRLGGMEIIQLLYDPPGSHIAVQVDLLVGKTDYHRTALDRRLPFELPGVDVELAVLSCEDLILHKLLAGRIIDRADVVSLLRGNGETLDREYLARWARSLNREQDLSAAWSEAVSDAR